MNRDGSRKVELLIPFEHLGLKYDSVLLRPVLFDHVLRWQAGEFRNAVHLLSALTGQQESTLRMLRYPDADRVIAAMIEMLPAEIRRDLIEGKIPIKFAEPSQGEEGEAAPQPAEPEAPVDDGSRLLEEDAA